MNDSASQLAYLRDPRVSAHAVASAPAWLWSVDATRILWANAVGAAIFDAASSAALNSRHFDASDPAAPQIARIASALPLDGIPRLEHLSGFGTEAAHTLTCGCSRIALPDGTPAILVVAAETAGPTLSLEERVQRLVAGLEVPVAVFASDGTLFHANHAAAGRLAVAATLETLGADTLATHALRAGYASGASKIGALSFDRIGDDAATFLIVALPAPAQTTPQPAEPPPQQADAFAPGVTADDDSAAESSDTPASPAATAAVATLPERRQPLRFVWQMDGETRFTLESEDFIRLTGSRTADALGQPWAEIVNRLGIDPKGEVAQAVASRDTWSGITIDWPVDGTEERLAVELSGLPVFDRERNFGGYRGFGVCRDPRRNSIAASLNQQSGASPDAVAEQPAPEPPGEENPAPETPLAEAPPAESPEAEAPSAENLAADEPPAEKPSVEERPLLSVVPQSENVVPFRATSDKTPSLSPGERSAFHELAKELTSRLQHPKAVPDLPPPEEGDFRDEQFGEDPLPVANDTGRGAEESQGMGFIPSRNFAEREPEPLRFRDDRAVLDRIPTGVLAYRLDMPLYANAAFLEWSGYDSLTSLTIAGGLDVLFVELDEKSGHTGDGQALRVTSNRGKQDPADGRLFNAPWEGESAHVLMLLPAAAPAKSPASADGALAAAEAQTRELTTILETASDGVLVLDGDGRILTANAAAEALFGRNITALTAASFADLIAPESQPAALDYLLEMRRAGAAPKKGREVIGRGPDGTLLPLFMTLGKLGEANRLCAVFRDLTSWKKTEMELVTARRQAEKTSSAKSEFLAKVSHEIRTPLNSIIGFSEVMMDERFGPIGNERYKQYLKDIHHSGGHLVSLLNDLLDLSKIEAGKLDLSFGRVSLNEVTQQCVSLMQPQANLERVIIRTSLPNVLPPIMADARSMRQIVLNLLSNSIKFTGAGGQVIVSTTHTDDGEVVLRVRDTGHAMTEKEIQMALEPFRQLATSSRWGSGGTGLGLPLTKALAEANRANFSIKSAVNTGTLVEVSFPPGRVLVA
jgi:PAS domain S-box-containing protein